MNSITRIHATLKEAELRNPPVVITVNDFTEEAVRSFMCQMSDAHNTGQHVIPIVIDSYGGLVHGLMAMISAIRSTNLPVATIIQGKAMSCGAVLASCGTPGYRFIDPLSTMLIHQVSAGAFGKIEEIKNKAAETDRLNKVLFSIMDKNAGKPPGYFWDLIHVNDHADIFLTAEDVIKHGLADHVRVPTLVTSIDVKFELK